jgi:hypothetical protein
MVVPPALPLPINGSLFFHHVGEAALHKIACRFYRACFRPFLRCLSASGGFVRLWRARRGTMGINFPLAIFLWAFMLFYFFLFDICRLSIFVH